MDHRDQHRENNGRFKGRTGAKYFVPLRNPIDAWMRRYGANPSKPAGNDPEPSTMQPSNGGEE
jgi:hypothetical protein